MNILKSNELRILYEEDTISVILEIKLWNILLSVFMLKKQDSER
jgi:hypothetical protein